MTTTPTTAPVTVRPASPDDRTAVADVITAAFFDDPVTEWLMPDRNDREPYVHPMFGLYFDLFQPHGEIYLTADGSGAALWLPPERELFPPEQLEDVARRTEEAAGPYTARLVELGDFFDAHAPAEPHWHLQLFAVLPDRQGQGIGSAILRDQLRRFDARGEAAYLEATTLRSKGLYERHGFELQGTITLPDGPTLWQMWRSPR